MLPISTFPVTGLAARSSVNLVSGNHSPKSNGAQTQESHVNLVNGEDRHHHVKGEETGPSALLKTGHKTNAVNNKAKSTATKKAPNAAIKPAPAKKAVNVKTKAVPVAKPVKTSVNPTPANAALANKNIKVGATVGPIPQVKRLKNVAVTGTPSLGVTATKPFDAKNLFNYTKDVNVNIDNLKSLLHIRRKRQTKYRATPVILVTPRRTSDKTVTSNTINNILGQINQGTKKAVNLYNQSKNRVKNVKTNLGKEQTWIKSNLQSFLTNAKSTLSNVEKLQGNIGKAMILKVDSIKAAGGNMDLDVPLNKKGYSEHMILLKAQKILLELKKFWAIAKLGVAKVRELKGTIRSEIDMTKKGMKIYLDNIVKKLDTITFKKKADAKKPVDKIAAKVTKPVGKVVAPVKKPVVKVKIPAKKALKKARV